MKKKNLLPLLGLFPLMILNIYVVLEGIQWLPEGIQAMVYLVLLWVYYKKIDYRNINLLGFFGFSIVATFLNLYSEIYSFYLITMGLYMLSYFFLGREALKYTKREAATKLMVFFFLLLIAANVYFLFNHLREMENHIQGSLEFGFFTLYYLNLSILGIIGLMYYLNSYSRKSVFMITLIMCLIFSDVFREMAAFYMSVKGVLVCESILRFFAVLLAFQFFLTPEKKLRLINLV